MRQLEFWRFLLDARFLAAAKQDEKGFSEGLHSEMGDFTA